MFNKREYGVGRLCYHRYNYGTPGWNEEGIRRRIRQGVGGPNRIEAGAEAEGHYHIPEGKKVGIGETIFTSDNSGTGGRWEVKVGHITTSPDMIVQNQPDVTGAEFKGTVIGRVS